jgi:hypothetical protein
MNLPAIGSVQHHLPRILQVQYQGPNIGFGYAIASHEKPHGGIPEQLVQSWLDANNTR